MEFDYQIAPALILLIGILVIWLSLRRILSLRAKVIRKWRRVAERIVLSFVVLFAAVITVSTSYNAVAQLWFHAHHPTPGQTYTVDGRKMYMDCTGSGSPTIVLDAGLGDHSDIWTKVQPALAKTTRVCAYDRAGFGLSESRPAPRDADHIAAELHSLLIQANVARPVVLMGHSIAGIYLRDYAAHYSEDLAGLIFVDGSTPMQQDNPAIKAVGGMGLPPWYILTLAKTAFIVGVPRLMGRCSSHTSGPDSEAAQMRAEDFCEMNPASSISEMRSMEQSGLETVHSGPYGDLPILVFSHDPTKSLPTENAAQKKVETVWSQMQEDLKKLSTRSRRIIAKNSGHYVQIDRTDLIDREVPLFIEQIRGTAPPADNYGSTATE
ncbi:alpha/beta hydrolase [Acidicapsa acidisoli]|uniref:alpha/beta hydrolase n=1 Tax=Acidicapsa acidisoli TaxID=1615681 RepID=UPI0021E0B117|nr:alpha/beta hydrolase [Acidicapsa acidisoli]